MSPGQILTFADWMRQNVLFFFCFFLAECTKSLLCFTAFTGAARVVTASTLLFYWSTGEINVSQQSEKHISGAFMLLVSHKESQGWWMKMMTCVYQFRHLNGPWTGGLAYIYPANISVFLCFFILSKWSHLCSTVSPCGENFIFLIFRVVFTVITTSIARVWDCTTIEPADPPRQHQ